MSFVVYHDASRNRIGPNSQVDQSLNRPLKPGEYAAIVLWLNIWGFLEYFRTRKKRLARATQYPCDASGIEVYMISITLFVLTLPFFLMLANI
jgi:hypothetical protein